MGTILMLVMAVNGGLYLGTIVYTAWKTAEMGRAIDVFHQISTFKIA